MFHDVYTYLNNQKTLLHNKQADPYGLRRCMRFYPHDDNQGGFFVAVFEKLVHDKSGIVHDSSYQMNAWENEKVRQKDVLTELEEFATWFEDAQKKHYEEKKVPKEEQEDLGLLKQVVDAKKREEEEVKASGIEVGSLSEQRALMAEKKEDEEFPFANLLMKKKAEWDELAAFYGIDDVFPCEYLYF